MPTDPNYGRTPPPWSSVFSGQGRRPVAPDQLRVSDAERQEIADALGKHFADGRLDRDELDERVHRAMSAKTRADFAGLLDDLPPAGAPAGATVPPPRRRRRLASPILLAVAVLVIVASFSAPWWHVPWLAIFVLAFLFFRGPRRWYHHHHHHPYGGQGTGPGAGGMDVI
jgi:hypothetical protein